MDRGNRQNKRKMFRDSRHQRKGSPVLMVIMIFLLFGVLYMLTIDLSDSKLVKWMLGEKSEMENVAIPDKQLAYGFAGDLILAYTADSCMLEYVSAKLKESNKRDLLQRLSLDAKNRWETTTDICEFALQFDAYDAIYWNEYVHNLDEWMLRCDSIYFTFGNFEEEQRKKVYIANLCMSEKNKAMGLILDSIGHRAFFELAINIKELERRTKRSFFMDVLTVDEGPFIKKELNRPSWSYSEEARQYRIKALQNLNKNKVAE